MSNLEQRLEKLMLRLDQMGLRVQQTLIDAVRAVRRGDLSDALRIKEQDTQIDREEVEIERECIRLLALYQPAAIDLRAICTIIKVNSDLERIADLASSIAKRTKHVVAEPLDINDYPDLLVLADEAVEAVGRTLRMINTADVAAARAIIEYDSRIDRRYKDFVSGVLNAQRDRAGGVEVAMTLIHLAKSFERIGDLCTNIAEDVIFLQTGDVVRHAAAFSRQPL